MMASTARRDQFKASVATGASERRRKIAVTITKERRNAAVRAKRIRRSDEAGDMEMHDEEAQQALEEKLKAEVEQLIQSTSDTRKGASQRKLDALRKVRRLLSSSALPPIHVAVDSGLVPVLVNCLQFGSSEEQLLEASWCLTNIASGDTQQTKAVLDSVPLLIAHLGETSPDAVLEQCAWALGNFAGDSEEVRDILLAQGAIRPLSWLLSSTKPSLATTVCWTLSNLIKGPNPKGASELLHLDGTLQALLRHLETKDEALVAEAAWVLVYISALSDTRPLLDAGFVAPLVKWLVDSNQLTVLTPVLRTIGNIVSGDNTRTDAVMAALTSVPGGIDRSLVRCLSSDSRSLQKECAWVISNMAAGSLQHKQALFPAVAQPLVLLLSNATLDVKREAAYALGNLCVYPKEPGTPSQALVEHLTALVPGGCVAAFVNLVTLPDVEASILGLQFLELVMRSIPNGPKLVDNYDGMLAIEMVHFHEHEELRNMANFLLDTYFNDDYEMQEEYGKTISNRA